MRGGVGHTLVNVLLGIILGDGSDTRLLGSGAITVVGSVDGVLEELVGVLLDYHHSCGLDDISEVLNEDLALG
jgi:hypothetical protein